MHRISLRYALCAPNEPVEDLYHPLIRLLQAIDRSGSISAAARELELSYRHVWGELKRWEAELGQPLVRWVKGQRAQLSPFGDKLLWAERRARARLAPQIEALRSELERAFAVVFDEQALVLSVQASHDEALPRLRERVARSGLHLDLQFSGSVDALDALNEGRCLVAGFHLRLDADRRSATARTYRPRLKPGRHKLIGFAQRCQGLIVAPGNPLHVQGLADLSRPGLRVVYRPRGTGSRVLFEELCAQAGLAGPAAALTEPSHAAVAEAVASGAADAGFGIETVARSRGLDFLPLVQERYVLAVLAPSLEQPAVQRLMQALRDPAWQAELATLPGYTPERCGEVLSLRAVLPWWSYRQPRR
ncbi:MULTISPECIES: substrate-binding domain-containing protein [Caldimonas]|uniref:helix-turn-helix transcriptional regulator n=1 Tax=Caldimonas TaxID=196013 RepID=UPI000376C3A9|nr:substrate-binding domain-containing protein [Caldimonas manganoxidans]GIX25593.1 MAG: LysR family transcriptional regulator [Caldimonas sp.]